MGFKLKGAPYDKSNMNIAVYKKDLTDGSIGKSNHTGIILKTGLDPETEQHVIAHEKVHQEQQAKGDLDYDKENFYWKGKTYPRENLNEHNEELPWEKEAYKASEKSRNKESKKMGSTKFKLNGHRGNNKPFSQLTSRGLIGASMNDTDGYSQPDYGSSMYDKDGASAPGEGDKEKKKAKAAADANLKKTEFKTEKLQDGRTRHYRSAEGSAEKPGSTLIKASTKGKKATDTDDYISKLKNRFPDATGKELVKKKYISSSYMDRFPAKKETATAKEEYFTKKPDTPKTPPTKTPPPPKKKCPPGYALKKSGGCVKMPSQKKRKNKGKSKGKSKQNLLSTKKSTECVFGEKC